ncbi:MAG TPA: PAS domain-containing protein [Nitrospirota bacterium]|nr:PAS domain-containing protein [Nitrospirota bacterium]
MFDQAKNRNIYSEIIHSLPQGVYLFDGRGRVLFSNPAAERLSGWTAEDLVNKNIQDIFHLLQPDGQKGTGEGFFTDAAQGRTCNSFYDALCILKDGSTDLMSVATCAVRDKESSGRRLLIFQEHVQLRTSEQERKKLADKLMAALSALQPLKGILPICSSCKKIRDRSGFWMEIEEYLTQRSKVEFSHSLCPGCATKLYPDFFTKAELEKKLRSLDKRNLARYILASPIDFVFPHDDSFSIHRGIMTDISDDGFGGYFWTDVRVGQEIIIKSKLPVAYQNAVICWVHKDKDNFFRTGLKFARSGKMLPDV